jgi:hypothetical protein
MSRGHGVMQRRILDELKSRTGGDWVWPDGSWAYGFKLADDIHDLRIVTKELARQFDGISHRDFRTGSWEASFSRAVRRLTRDGTLEFPSILPAVKDEAHYCERTSDGLFYVQHHEKLQRRFVRLSVQKGGSS